MSWLAPPDICLRPELLAPFYPALGTSEPVAQENRALPANGSREKARSEDGLSPQGGHHLCFPAGPGPDSCPRLCRAELLSRGRGASAQYAEVAGCTGFTLICY